MNCDVCGREHPEGTKFLVVLRRRGWGRTAYSPILGPFATHRDALDRLDEGRRLAREADPRTSFDDAGTVAVGADSQMVGLLNEEKA